MLYIRNEKWLASCVLILHLVSYLSAESPTQESYSVRYFPSDNKVKGDQLSSTSCMVPGRLARIITTRLVKIACYALKNHSRHLFWTGLSWNNSKFFWIDCSKSIVQVDEIITSLVTNSSGGKEYCLLVNTTTAEMVTEACTNEITNICQEENKTTSSHSIERSKTQPDLSKETMTKTFPTTPPSSSSLSSSLSSSSSSLSSTSSSPSTSFSSSPLSPSISSSSSSTTSLSPSSPSTWFSSSSLSPLTSSSSLSSTSLSPSTSFSSSPLSPSISSSSSSTTSLSPSSPSTWFSSSSLSPLTSSSSLSSTSLSPSTSFSSSPLSPSITSSSSSTTSLSPLSPSTWFSSSSLSPSTSSSSSSTTSSSPSTSFSSSPLSPSISSSSSSTTSLSPSSPSTWFSSSSLSPLTSSSSLSSTSLSPSTSFSSSSLSPSTSSSSLSSTSSSPSTSFSSSSLSPSTSSSSSSTTSSSPSTSFSSSPLSPSISSSSSSTTSLSPSSPSTWFSSSSLPPLTSSSSLSSTSLSPSTSFSSSPLSPSITSSSSSTTSLSPLSPSRWFSSSSLSPLTSSSSLSSTSLSPSTSFSSSPLSPSISSSSSSTTSLSPSTWFSSSSLSPLTSSSSLSSTSLSPSTSFSLSPLSPSISSSSSSTTSLSPSSPSTWFSSSSLPPLTSSSSLSSTSLSPSTSFSSSPLSPSITSSSSSTTSLSPLSPSTWFSSSSLSPSTSSSSSWTTSSSPSTSFLSSPLSPSISSSSSSTTSLSPSSPSTWYSTSSLSPLTSSSSSPSTSFSSSSLSPTSSSSSLSSTSSSPSTSFSSLSLSPSTSSSSSSTTSSSPSTSFSSLSLSPSTSSSSSSTTSLSPSTSFSLSSLLPSTSSSSLSSLSSSSSSSSTTTIKTAAAKLLKTSTTLAVNLSNGFTLPSISEKTHTWLSVKTTTSPIVYSTELLTPSPSIESPRGSNFAEKLRQAIEKLKSLNVTYKDSLQNAVTIIQNLFEDLKDTDEEGNETVNVLVATQQLESFASEYAKIHFKKNQTVIIIIEENFEMMIQRLAANNKDPLVFSANNIAQQLEKEWVGIELPSEVLKGKDIVICIIYNDIRKFVPEFPGLVLRNPIIAAEVYPPPQGTLQENVTISFGRDKEEVDKSHCVFWNFTIKSTVNGSWSRKGCSLVRSDDNKIICTCNHLTNFAVLMQVGELENEVTSEHLVTMEIITYVGCALSLTAEVLTIIAYCTLTDFKQELVQIRLNLVVALAASQLAFLSGIDALEPKGLCVFVAALIHYFYLVGFAWMLFEGVYLYLMVVKVFNTEIRIRAFYSVAWGCPAGIVVLSIVLAACQEGGLHSYIHGAFCWVSFSNNLIWTFVAPVLLVCVTNTVLLSFVIHEILKVESDKPSKVEKFRQAAKGCVVLLPLLGITWVFGTLSVTSAGLVFQYVFTILNSLQGLFIFLLHVLRNTDVRAEFKRKKRMLLEMRSRVADLRSSDKRTRKAVRTDAFELKEKHGVTLVQQKQIFQEPLIPEVSN